MRTRPLARYSRASRDRGPASKERADGGIGHRVERSAAVRRSLSRGVRRALGFAAGRAPYSRGEAPDEATLAELFDLAALAPSVGNCQPTRFVRVDDEKRRALIRANFEAANRQALMAYSGERAQLYARLKLAGMRDAPIQLAVFCDEATGQGHGLGALTMPETRRYSTVCALYTFWLAARARGLGVGWVSILDPQTIAEALDVREAGRSSAISA